MSEKEVRAAFERIDDLKKLEESQLKEWGVVFKKHPHGVESLEFDKYYEMTVDDIYSLIDTRNEAIELLTTLQAALSQQSNANQKLREALEKLLTYKDVICDKSCQSAWVSEELAGDLNFAEQALKQTNGKV